jgi:hypothetical protein
MEEGQQSFWETLNYALVVVALVVVGIVSQVRRREEPMLPVAQEEPVDQEGETGEEEAGNE